MTGVARSMRFARNWTPGRRWAEAPGELRETPASPNDAPKSEAESPPLDHPLADVAQGNRIPIRAILLSLGLVAALAIGVAMRIKTTEYFWQNPIADANFQTITDFDGTEQAGQRSHGTVSSSGVSVGPGWKDGRLGHAGGARGSSTT